MKDTASSLTYGCLSPAILDVVWPDIEKLLSPAVETSMGRFTPEDVYRDIQNGVLVLWVVADGVTPVAAITSRIVVYPRRRGLVLDWVGGGQMKEWLPMVIETMSQFARDNGCAHIEGYGRKAWGRVLQRYGFKPDYIAWSMDLEGSDG